MSYECSKEGMIYDPEDPTGYTIAFLNTYTDKKEGALLAAAPDLLAECERTQDELASAIRDGAGAHFDKDMLERWYKGVTAAITKAKGE